MLEFNVLTCYYIPPPPPPPVRMYSGDTMCSKYGFGIAMSEGIIYLRLRIMLLVGMSWADVWSVMLARGVMCDVRHPRQEEAL